MRAEMENQNADSAERKLPADRPEQGQGEVREGMRQIDDLIEQLERASEQLRSGELSADAAATLVEDCAALATRASAQIERMARSEAAPAVPGQESLL
jgi:signal transduction histidine kinase